jgi:hypothetical protein
VAQFEERAERLLGAGKGGALGRGDLDLFEFLHHEDVYPMTDLGEREEGEEKERGDETVGCCGTGFRGAA